ncbi:sulfotransferase [Planomonospora parontospora]|uniref:sulfotransferase n=1 Tax=Planomonospora parontospora TaxID=58119 RepID=UPI00166F8654|nr:sulfotransferase [Planomonospora parontospora]GGL11654.1 sulfotransferase [Planomonospora parontospora subsp. antibiotica]GII14911.1 sulfotransferase [Planomonospora parontospora subsp. antibiotica]
MSVRPQPTRVVFLGGLGRSGTTLLERLLGELPGCVALGEVVHLWARGVLADEACGCGEPFGACPFWLKVGDRAFGGWSAERAERVLELRRRVDRTRRIPGLARLLAEERAGAGAWRSPTVTEELGEYATAYRRLYEAAAEVADSPLVVDSSKHASLAFCLAAAGVDVHVVHVVRDPRAVAHSWRRRVARPEDGTPMTIWSPARTSMHWLTQNLGLELLAREGVPVTRIRYEDLLGSPARTLRRLAAGLGVRPSLGFLGDGEAELSVAHTASGNPVRFTVGRIGLTRDDGWRTGAPPRQRSLVTALTWPLMLKYDYPWRLS